MSEEKNYARHARAEYAPDTEALEFKKTDQVVGRPTVVDSIEEPFVRDPPKNKPIVSVEDHGIGVRGEVSGTRVPKSKIDPKAPKDIIAVEEVPTGAGEGISLGRPPRFDVKNELIEDSEI